MLTHAAFTSSTTTSNHVKKTYDTWIFSPPPLSQHSPAHPSTNQAYTHHHDIHVYVPVGVVKSGQGGECVNKIRFSGLPGAGLDGRGGRYTNWIRLGLPMPRSPPSRIREPNGKRCYIIRNV